MVNIVLDIAITPKNVGAILEGFKRRAIHENSPLNFLEFTNIDSEALTLLMHSFKYGFLHKKEKLFVDLRETAIKLPNHKMVHLN